MYRNGVGIEVLEALAPRLAARGWHAQIWIHAPDLVTLGPRLKALGLPLVIDHMGRMATSRGVADPGFRRSARCWRRAWPGPRSRALTGSSRPARRMNRSIPSSRR